MRENTTATASSDRLCDPRASPEWSGELGLQVQFCAQLERKSCDEKLHKCGGVCGVVEFLRRMKVATPAASDVAVTRLRPVSHRTCRSVVNYDAAGKDSLEQKRTVRHV